MKIPNDVVCITNCTFIKRFYTFKKVRMLILKVSSQKAWPFRYAERFSGTSPPRADLLFLAMQKSKSHLMNDSQY